MRWLAFLAFATLSCTANNPNYVGHTTSKDLAGVVGVPDLAGAAPEDLATGGGHGDLAVVACSGAERTCVSAPEVASERCATDVFVVDRRCPFGAFSTSGGTTIGTGAACQSGYCAPPTTGTNTNCDVANMGPTDRSCVTTGGPGNGRARSCQPFVNPSSRAISWRCVLPATTTGSAGGVACARDSDCRSGLCAANKRCFAACLVAADCAVTTQACAATEIVVEGVTVAVHSCAAP
jgi:hypothetical protein